MIKKLVSPRGAGNTLGLANDPQKRRQGEKRREGKGRRKINEDA